MNGTRSEFSAALEGVFDLTGAFTRAQWASILNVPQDEIARWLKDSELAFPSPETLRRVLRIAREIRDSLPSDARRLVDDFIALLRRPVGEIARHAPWNRAKTLEHYMVSATRKAFLELLDTLEPANQEKVLAAASGIARAERDKEEEKDA